MKPVVITMRSGSARTPRVRATYAASTSRAAAEPTRIAVAEVGVGEVAEHPAHRGTQSRRGKVDTSGLPGRKSNAARFGVAGHGPPRGGSPVRAAAGVHATAVPEPWRAASHPSTTSWS